MRECPAEVLDIVVKLIVVPAKNVVLLLDMLLVGAEVLPADLAVVRRGDGHLHRICRAGGGKALLGREHLPQAFLEVNAVSLQFALLCFLCERGLTVSVARRKEGVEWDRSGLKEGRQDRVGWGGLNGGWFTAGEGRSRRRWAVSCSQA